MFKVYETELAGRKLTIETGKMAALANGSVLVRYGDTVVMVNVTASKEPKEGIEQYLNRVLSNSISVFDTKARKEEKESSYHNLLVGILTGNADWLVKSNVEAGDGFADIIVETDNPDAGIVAELKYTKNFDEMRIACRKAMNQIRDRRYQEYLLNDDRRDIRLYGIAFCKKRCCVISEKLEK